MTVVLGQWDRLLKELRENPDLLYAAKADYRTRPWDKSETALTGPEGGPVKTRSLTITNDMSAEGATRIYMAIQQVCKQR